MVQLDDLHRRILGAELDSSPPGGAAKAFLLVHTPFANAEIAPQTALMTADAAPDPDAYAEVLQQSWNCPGAQDLLRGGLATCLVAEMMARHLSPPDRATLFHGVLQAVVEVTAPDALVFKHAQQVIAPADYLAACADKEPILRPGSLNVRFFNISDSDGDMIMDTRGLEEVGLHDLQCHFRDLVPDDVARLLYNTGVYIFQRGPVIESGHTIEGTEPGSKWRCQFENSLLDPRREVLDLDPGPPYAAGNRAG